MRSGNRSRTADPRYSSDGKVNCPLRGADVDTDRCSSCGYLAESGWEDGQLWLRCRTHSGLERLLLGVRPF